tara:strand:- start:158 stop:334 length:177 start_codon:yes stop_codon:yes gene_type:complete
VTKNGFTEATEGAFNFIFKSYECRNYSNAENTDAEINQILKSLCLNTKFFKKISGNKY